MDKVIVVIIIIVILAGFIFWAFQSGFLANIFSGPVKPTDLPQGIVLFYGEGCPHCKNVDDFVTQNKIEDKVKFTRLEVWHNLSNAKLLGNVAVGCKIDVSGGVPVPFLYDGKNCVTGDADVINFFKNAANIQ